MSKHLAVLLCIAFCLSSCSGDQPRYLQLHQSALVADTHCDTVLKIRKGFDFSVRNDEGHMDIPRLKEGGTDLQVFACWVDTDTPKDSCRVKVDGLLDVLDSVFACHSEQIAVGTTATLAEGIVADGKIAAFLGVENGVAIAGDLDNLQHFYDRGVRYMTLTHTASSDWCISSADTAPAFHGLTDFGREVVRKMNDIGMIIDVSHASVEAVEEVLKVSTEPVIASHSCVYALCQHDRNLTDAQIKAIAATGGGVFLNYYDEYLSQEWLEVGDSLWESRLTEIDSIKQLYKDDDSARNAAIQPIKKWFREKIADVPVTVGTVADHIDYIVNLVGPDYVGLGSDWDGVPYMPERLKDCSMVPNITRELLARGYSDEDVRKILGGNFMRIFRQVCSKP